MTYARGQTYPAVTPLPLFEEGEAAWYALLSRPQREGAAKEWLAHRDVYSFFPVTQAFRIRPGARIQRVLYYRKYLPGYVFAHVPGEPVWHRLFGGPFIRDALRMSSGVPGKLAEDTLSGLLDLRARDELLEEKRRLSRIIAKGDRARVKDGAYEGWVVEVIHVDTATGKGKFAIKLLGEREAEIELSRLEKVKT